MVIKPLVDHSTDLPLSVLLVEDDDDDVMLIEQCLGDTPQQVSLVRAKDGQEALDCLKAQCALGGPQQQLILLDLSMPVMDGRQFLDRLRQDEALRHLPVVVLTTSPSPDDIKDMYDRGCNSYVVKRLGYREFCKNIRQIMKYWQTAVRLPA